MSDPSNAPTPGPSTLATPTPPRERIAAIDSLRGLVLLGILFMNMPVFGLPHWASDNPAVAGGITGPDWWAWFLSAVLWDGKMRAIFSMLFGAGVVLLTRRAEESGPAGAARGAEVFSRRMVWLMLFGIADAYILAWPGDVLYWYGLVGLVLYPLRRVRARTLIIAVLLIFAVRIGVSVVGHEKREAKLAQVLALRADVAAGKELTEEQKGKLEAWDEGIKEQFPPKEKVEKNIEARRGGYFSTIGAVAPVVMEWNSFPIYLDSDILPMMILGMGLATAGVLTGQRSTRFYATFAVVCLPLGWWVAAIGPLEWSRHNFDPEHIRSYANGAAWGYIAQRLLLAMGYVCLVMLAARARWLAWPMSAVAAAGRMPLTNYLGQSLICLFIFSGVGLGLFAKLSRWELVVLTVAICIVQVIFSVWWVRRHAFGPMEWVWRWCAYGEKPAWGIER
ncbi:MAG: DUF418 domain-containing protein [Phycisphaerales bacterium]